MTETIGMVLDRIEEQQANALQLRPDAMSIDLLRAVYRSASIPLPVRLRAAIAALPHEVPRLQVSALVNEQSFAEILERVTPVKEDGSDQRKPTDTDTDTDD